MEKKYLPIGSICTITGKNKKIMIIGYYGSKFDGNLKVYDYVGCVYPEGLLISDQLNLFNHSDIESVDFVGFKNEEQEKFMNLFNGLTGNISEEEKAADFHQKNDMFLASSKTYSKLLFDENGVVMIAEPAVSNNEEKDNKYSFDRNGNVIGDNTSNKGINPFHQEYNQQTLKEKDPSDWGIFGNVKFNEDGVVIEDNTQKAKETLNDIKFDENGTVISVSGDDLKPKTDYSQYKFDENGIVVSMESAGSNNEPNSSKYKFDENGTVISE